MPAVADTCQRGDIAFVERVVDQAVAIDVEREQLRGAKQHGAELRLDYAAIGGVVAGQHHIAALACFQHAVIDNVGARRRSRFATEHIAAREEIVVANSQSARHQPADIQHCAAAKINAVAVDQKHLAVGAQTAEDVRDIIADHTVENHR